MMDAANIEATYGVKPYSARRVKRITSHAGISRFLSECQQIGFIPRDRAIPSPYAFSPTHTAYQDARGRSVFIVETLHRRYVFEFTGGVFKRQSDAEKANLERSKESERTRLQVLAS